MKQENKSKNFKKVLTHSAFSEGFSEDWYEKYIQNKNLITSPGFMFWKTSIKKINQVIKEELSFKHLNNAENIEKILAFNTITHSQYLPQVFHFTWKKISIENKKLLISKIYDFLFSIKEPSKKHIEMSSKWSSLMYFDYIQQIKNKLKEKKLTNNLNEENRDVEFLKVSWINQQELLKNMIENSSFSEDSFFISRLNEQTSNTFFLFQNKVDSMCHNQEKESFENFLHNLSFLSYIVKKIKDTEENLQLFNVMSIFSRITPPGVINNTYKSISNSVVSEFSKNEKTLSVLVDSLLMICVFSNIIANVKEKSLLFSFKNEVGDSEELSKMYFNAGMFKKHIKSIYQEDPSKTNGLIKNKSLLKLLPSSSSRISALPMTTKGLSNGCSNSNSKEKSEIIKVFLEGFFDSLKLSIHVAISSADGGAHNEEQKKETALVKKNTQRF